VNRDLVNWLARDFGVVAASAGAEDDMIAVGEGVAENPPRDAQHLLHLFGVADEVLPVQLAGSTRPADQAPARLVADTAIWTRGGPAGPLAIATASGQARRC
jgi:hypothetical protein